MSALLGPSKPDLVPKNAIVLENAHEPNDATTAYVSYKNSTWFASSFVLMNDDYKINGNEMSLEAGFTPAPANTEECSEALMLNTSLCSHSSYKGGKEKKFFRGANGHTRFVTCKEAECDKSVILAKRREPEQLWRYLVQIALCTLWGAAARSRTLFSDVTQARVTALEADERDAALNPPRGYPHKTEGVLPSSPARSDRWHVVAGDPSSPSNSTSSAPVTAKIVRCSTPEPGTPQGWVYGILLSSEHELPEFPSLDDGDLDVLQPLPTDDSVCGPATPYEGWTFSQLASSVEAAAYCQSIMHFALENNPMAPELYRLAFYLYARTKLVRSSAIRQLKGEPLRPSKRSSDPSSMSATRLIRVPVSPDVRRPYLAQLHDCEVMMVEEVDTNDDNAAIAMAYTAAPEDPPGLALLDSGCTRSMHGREWAERYEAELSKLGLSIQSKLKRQSFSGVGGKVESHATKVFPVGIGGVHGELHSAETPGNVPLLVSRPFMEELGTTIDFGKGVVHFEKIGVRDLPLIKTSRGHLAVSLLNFNKNQMDEFEQEDLAEEAKQIKQDYVDKLHNPADESLRFETPEEREAWFDEMMLQNDAVPPDPDLHDFTGPDDGEPPSDLSMWQEEIRHLEDYRRRHPEHYAQMFGQQDPTDEGLLCEDENYFVENESLFTVRKASGKKAKKIASWSANLDGDDWHARNVLSRGSKVPPRKPPYGKVWLKQLFAGQMGLTLLAVSLGLRVGCPLDFSSSSWDASTHEGYKWLCSDLINEDPYLLVITQPCGPWGNWARFNLSRGGAAAMTVLDKQTEGRPVLKLVNRAIRDRVRAKRHVFVEQPLGSTWLEEPEMADVNQMLQTGELILLKVDGCQLGYKDLESELPNKKPSQYLTTLLTAESIFGSMVCDGSHQHQHLEGANAYGSRTVQASVWPEDLNRAVLDAALQQAVIEKVAASSLEEAFPAVVREQPEQGGRRPKRQRRGRVAILSNPYNAPPVYLRPTAPLQPEVPALEDSAPQDAPVEDDHEVRARQVAELDPILNMSEQERRRRWLEVDPDLRKILRDLHVQFGHPTSVTLQRILRRQNAKLKPFVEPTFFLATVVARPSEGRDQSLFGFLASTSSISTCRSMSSMRRTLLAPLLPSSTSSAKLRVSKW